jgi:hypothetical protein
MPTVTTSYHYPVLTFGILAIGATFAVAIWCNYFYGWSFPASILGFGIPLLGIAYVLSLLFAKDWTPVLPSGQFKGSIWVAIAMMWLGLCVLASIAVAVSTRFGQVVTLGITFGAFVIGLMSDWLIARRLRDIGGMLERLAKDGSAGSALDANHAQLALLKVAYAIVPNFQVFWLSDAIQQKRDIPVAYLMPSVAYGAAMIVAVMCVAVALFQRREVG